MGCPFCEKIGDISQIPDDELVWDFPNSVALLGPWQFYQGYCVLVCKTHAKELHHLPEDVRLGYLEELNEMAGVLEKAFKPRKLNLELIGNQVAHLHWHIFPRYVEDAAHLKPVWTAIDRADSDPSERARLSRGKMGRLETMQRIQAGLTR